MTLPAHGARDIGPDDDHAVLLEEYVPVLAAALMYPWATTADAGKCVAPADDSGGRSA